MNFPPLRIPLFLFLHVAITFSLSSQDPRKRDSLRKVLAVQLKEDTNRIRALQAYASDVSYSNIDTALLLFHQTLQLSDKLKFTDGIVEAWFGLGSCYWQKGEYDLSMENFLKMLLHMQKTGNKKGIARSYVNIALIQKERSNHHLAAESIRKAIAIHTELGKSKDKAVIFSSKKNLVVCYLNMGVIYGELADFPRALEYFFKNLKLNEELGGEEDIAQSYNNIGVIYLQQSDYTRAKEYFLKSIRIKERLGNKPDLINSYNNTGSIYLLTNEYVSAREYFSRSMRIAKELGHKKGIMFTASSIGDWFTKLAGKDSIYPGIWGKQVTAKTITDSSIYYYTLTINLARELGDKMMIAASLRGIALLYQNQKNYRSAIPYYQKAIFLADSLGLLQESAEGNYDLSFCYEKTGNPAKALEHYKRYTQLNDSIYNSKKSEEIGRMEAEAEYSKHQAVADAKHKEEIKRNQSLAKAEQNRQKMILYFTLAIALAAGIISLVILRSLKVTRKQKNIIELQKAEVTEKNKEIVDSITYAKRLQEAILPLEKSWKERLPDSFLFYRPKDIVAGDFYWIEETEDRIFFAAADCTGHGVPGALVSVVCSNALDRAVKEFKIGDPGKILDKARELVLETFGKSEERVNDGMDISLCCIVKPKQKNAATAILEWAGAQNPLWYVQNKKFMVVAGDKQPVGRYDHEKPFATHRITLWKGDPLYIFSDGFADQFGGPDGKKFKYKKLQELLLLNHNKPMDEQKKLLENTFNEWKSSLEQVDDVCVIGVRI